MRETKNPEQALSSLPLFQQRVAKYYEGTNESKFTLPSLDVKTKRMSSIVSRIHHTTIWCSLHRIENTLPPTRE